MSYLLRDHKSMSGKLEQLIEAGLMDEISEIAVADRSQVIPLSHVQERLWLVHEYMKEQRTSYNITTAIHFHGDQFSVAAFRAAFNALLARHEVLRTCFRMSSSNIQAEQVIAESLELDVPLLKVTVEQVKEIINENMHLIFDLANGPVLKAIILHVSNTYHVVIINIHHIVSDGWSQGIILRDLHQFYNSHLAGVTPELSKFSIQYADYSVWQRQQDLSTHLDYWKEMLGGYEEGLELPYDYPRAADRGWQAVIIQYQYPQSLVDKLVAYSQSHQITLFMVLLTSLAVTLHRYTGREDLCIGTTVAGRNRIELESMVGFFINILPLRLDLSGNPSFEDLLQTVKRLVLQGFEHQELPFEHLLNALRKQRDSSQIPLVPVMLRHQNFPMTSIDAWSEGVVVKKVELGADRTTPSELDWQFYGDGSYLDLSLEYAADLFSEDTAQRMIAHHQQVLEALVSEPSTRLRDFCLLIQSEQALFAKVNETVCSIDTSLSLVECFEQQAAATPDAVACISISRGSSVRKYVNKQISYHQLNARSNQLAHRLRELGIEPETPVGVLCGHSQELLLGLIAIWKVGGCYVPLDPQYPEHYLEQIIHDVAPKVILSTSQLLSKLSGTDACAWLDLDDDQCFCAPTLLHLSEDNLVGLAKSARDPAHLACIMYTSGSTGKPKGVMVPYQQIQNWLTASWDRLPFEPGEVLLQKTPIAFAVSVKELLSGLLAGIPQVMLEDSLVKDSGALKALIQEWKVTRLYLVPSHMQSLLIDEDEARELQSLK